MPSGVVIVGGGQGGYQAAASLRSEGYDGPLRLIGEEPGLPYQRPPLSKAFLLGKQDETQILLRPEKFYTDRSIDLLAGERVTAIDPAARHVDLASGGSLDYDHLILAVGARNRVLDIPGSTLDHVCYLRTLAESQAIKQRLAEVDSVAIIGGGFIGLEVAAAARGLGKAVTVFEAQSHLMARAMTPIVSDYFQSTHRDQGVEVLLNTTVREIRRGEVLLSDGTARPAGLVVIGIGVVPNTELAESAGLATGNGITVDEYLRTEAEDVYALGDCAGYPSVHAAGRVRLESVQNAVDHAVAIARTLTGKPAPYTAVPWFWTDQFDIRMQMVGISTGFDQVAVRGTLDARKFSAFYFREGRLLAIDSINKPADHLAGRKLIAAGISVTPEQAMDESFDLKAAGRPTP